MKPSKPKNNGGIAQSHQQDCCVSRHLINSLLSKQLKGILNLDASNEISSSIDKIDSNQKKNIESFSIQGINSSSGEQKSNSKNSSSNSSNKLLEVKKDLNIKK
jgi:hypothetical protein